MDPDGTAQMRRLTWIHAGRKRIRCKSHYAVLGITPKATQKEIKDAYIKLSKQLHPDQNRNSKSHDMFVQINEAYEVLGKDLSRREYDERLSFRPRPSSNPYQTPARPSNYYSSGQFYEDRSYRTHFDPSNPYGRRYNNPYDNDPFTDENYDFGYYKRKSYRVRRPRPTRILTREERKAAEEKLRLHRLFSFYSFGVFFVILTLAQIYTSESDYLVQKQEEKAEPRWEEPDEEPEELNDKYVTLFGRIFLALLVSMILYVLKDVCYGYYLDYAISELREELARRKKMQEHKMAEGIIRSINPHPGKAD